MKKIVKYLVLLFFIFLVTGCSSQTPYIGENGNWWIDGQDSGVLAQGEQGKEGSVGVSITKIDKTSSEGNIDTYTISFSNGQTTTFNVTNGDDLTIKSVSKTDTNGLVDTYKIIFSDNSESTFTITNGEDGEIVTISSIKKTKTEGLIDTYTITYTDGKSLSFTVTNGKAGEDGKTPYIGENGNWWIGDEDTGYFAGYLVDDSELTPESSGLIFTNAVVNGKAGLVVTDWDGGMLDVELGDAIESGQRNCDIVIPNYVGATPVIGIESGVFSGATYLTSIKLSKNTVYLGDEVFKNCTKLSSIDFNDCQLTTIPDYCFYGTNITEIELPKTVTKLGNYAFGNIYFDDFDYSNITYFGERCLQNLMTPYVYLSKDVTYVGSYAFASTYVFIEHDTIPTTWGSNIGGNDAACYSTVQTGCINSTDYIYSKYNNGISLHAYKGSEKWLIIPKTIDGFTVKQIGYGFDSLTENYIDYMIGYYEDMGLGDDEDIIYKFKNMEGIIIPNTVTSIEYGALMNYGAFIYIPESVNTMSKYIGWFLGEDDIIGSMLAFESTSLPTFKESWIETSNSCTLNDYSNYVATGVDYSKVSYDSTKQMVFYRETLGYSLLSCLDYDSTSIKIPATYNNSKVYTIRKAAVKANYRLKSITIENGITKIQGYAFSILSNLEFVYIPSSVEIINAYGFYNVGNKYYVVATQKPAEWDSYWLGSNSGNYSVSYGVTYDIKSYGDFIYYVNSSNTITLLSYIGTYGNSVEIKIPRKIDGKNVTTISTGFYYDSYRRTGVKIYIPSTVTIVESTAFKFYSYYNYSYYLNFYFEFDSIPSTWNSNWVYDIYSGYSSYYNTNYTQVFDY